MGVGILLHVARAPTEGFFHPDLFLVNLCVLVRGDEHAAREAFRQDQQSWTFFDPLLILAMRYQ